MKMWRGSGRWPGSGGITITPRVAIMSIFIVVVLGVTAFVAGGVLNRDEASASEVLLEPTLTAGTNPFMPPVGMDEVNVRPPPKAGGSRLGSTIGLYGGSGQQASCDLDRLIAFLAADRDKAAAWASVLGIEPDGIKSYIAGLTSVILRADTAVTNHGFKDGQATTIPAVLQAGTAVLVDKFGNPVVKCYCGNPLKAPVSYSRPRYEGKAWSGFSPTEITVVKKADTVVEKFVLVHPRTGKAVPRTPGKRDHPPPPPLPWPPPPPEGSDGENPGGENSGSENSGSGHSGSGHSGGNPRGDNPDGEDKTQAEYELPAGPSRGNQPTPTARPSPGNQPTPTARPSPGNQPTPTARPSPGNQPTPTARPSPRNQPTVERPRPTVERPRPSVERPRPPERPAEERVQRPERPAEERAQRPERSDDRPQRSERSSER
jgi:hypothetical protein